MNRPDIEGIRARMQDPLIDLLDIGDREDLLAYITDLEQHQLPPSCGEGCDSCPPPKDCPLNGVFRDCAADRIKDLSQRLEWVEKERDDAKDKYLANATWAEKDLYARNRELMARLVRAEKVVGMVRMARDELGVVQPEYPMPVAVCAETLDAALAEWEGKDA